MMIDLVSVLRQQIRQHPNHVRGGFVIETQQDDASMSMTIPKYEISESLVSGQKYLIISDRPGEYVHVDGATSDLKDGNDVVSLAAKSLCDDGPEALIDDAVHLRS